MKKSLITLAAITLLALLAIPAYAQDQGDVVTDEAIDAAVQEAAAQEAVNVVIEEAGLSPEAMQDETVTEEDLDAKTPGAFQFLKTIKQRMEGK